MGPLGEMRMAGEMSRLDVPRQRSEDLRQLAADERRRAERAGRLRAIYAARAADGQERLQPVYARAAELHRQIEIRQLASARLHETYADRVDSRAGHPPPSAPQILMEAVAETLGVPGAAASLYTRGSPAPVLVAASDTTSRAACELEAASGQGPVTTIMTTGSPVHAAGAGLASRWPRYGRAAARLGIGTVTAVPLQLPVVRVGALCCYQPWPAGEDVLVKAQTLAGALTPILLRVAPADPLPS
jgi:hypothetical protein